MRRVFLGAGLAVMSFGALAQSTPVQVSDAWARASAGAAKTGAVFMTITDTGAADRVTGVSTPVASMADVHETINAAGVMQMRAVPGGLALAPGKPVTLAPGGYHVMLMGLQHPLKQGETFPITLSFEHAAPVTVTVAVGGVGGMGPVAGH